ncbi:MAG TPA: amino acid permease [Vicinamibacterales bacterium]|nr:amino acid permease [Vicinamibacterales bacterium]
MTTETTTPTQQSLERRLGPYDGAAIIVSNVIGGGILFTPPLIAAGIPNPWLFLAVWLVGGGLAFAGAMAYAELAALRPRAGGEYVYLRAAYGPLAGFLTGWVSFVAGFAGAIAASSVVLVFYLDRFAPGVANDAPFFVIPLPFVPLTVSRLTLFAILTVWLLAFVHLRGVGPGRLVSNVLAVLKVTALLIFIAVAFSVGAGSASNVQQVAGPVAPTSWLLALIPVMFTYSGWNAAAYMAEEIRDPGRNAPRALAIGTGAVILIYVLLNLLYLYVMPVGELAGVQGSVLDVVADRTLGAGAGDIMGLVSIISLAASVSAMTFAGPRVYYAMARDGVFFPAAGRVHRRFKTPAISIVAQSSWASLLILSGSAESLTLYTGFAVTLFATIAVAAVFVLRAREPDAPRPFKAIGYPFTPAIFVIVGTAMVINAVYRDPGPSGAGLLVLAAGVPIYLWFRTRTRTKN